MSSHYKVFSVINCLLLLAVMFPAVQARRGGGFGRGGGRGGGWGGTSSGRAGWGGGGGHYRGPPAGGSAGHSTGKVVGAAAAGALGGMMVGHGLSSMGRPGYGYGHGYGGYGGYGYGHGYGHGHGHGGHGGHHVAGEHNETDLDYYTDAACNGPVYSCMMVFGLVMSFILGHFLS